MSKPLAPKTPTSPSGPVEQQERTAPTHDGQGQAPVDRPPGKAADPDAGQHGSQRHEEGERPIADVDRKVRPGDA